MRTRRSRPCWRRRALRLARHRRSALQRRNRDRAAVARGAVLRRAHPPAGDATCSRARRRSRLRQYRGRRRAAVRHRGSRRSGGQARRTGRRQVVPCPSRFRFQPPSHERSSASLASLSSRQRAEVLRQCRTARARRGHPRPRRLGPPRRERCCPPAGSQRAARRRLRRSRAHGAHQPVAARIGGSRRDRSAVARPHPHPEGRNRRAGREVDAAITRIAQPARHHPSDLADADSRICARHRERLRHRNGLRPHCRAHHRSGGLHRRPRRGENACGQRVALCARSASSMLRTPRTSRPSIPSSATSPTWTACALGRSLARHGLRRHGLHSSHADRSHPSRIRAFASRTREGAEDCRGLRRCAGERARRCQPRLQDDRRSGRAIAPSSWWRAPGKWASSQRPKDGQHEHSLPPQNSSSTPPDAAFPPSSTVASKRLTPASTAIAPPATSTARRFAATPTIPRTATSACPTSKPRCVSAACAMA